MKPSDDLHQLIHSLSVNEKGYFKKHYAGLKHKSNEAYLELFDIIASQEVYDERDVKKKMRDRSISGYFSKARARLWDMIIRSLREYETADTQEEQLFGMVIEARILFKKQMLQQCYHVLTKAFETAVAQHHHELALHVLKIMAGGISFHFNSFREQLDESHRIETEWKQLLDKSEMRRELYQLNFRSAIMFSFFNHETEACHVLTDAFHKLPEEEYKAAGDIFYIQYLYLKGVNAFYEKDFTGAENALRQIMRLCETQDDATHLTNYFLSVTNIMMLKSKMDKKDEALALAREAYKKLQSIQYGMGYQNQLVAFGMNYCHVFIDSGDHEIMHTFCDDLEKALVRYRGNFKKQPLFLAYLMLVSMYFVTGNYKMALRNINILLKDKKAALKTRLYIEIRTYELCIHFILQNDDLVESITRSMEKTLHDTPDAAAPFTRDLMRSITQSDPLRINQFADEQLRYFETINRNELQAIHEGQYIILMRWLNELKNTAGRNSGKGMT